jgi:GT2 family glycosyltransferase
VPSDPDQVAVGVLTWRGEASTRRCLTTLLALGSIPAADIVVVDNDSGTGEGDRLAAEFGVAALTMPANGGVAYGYNAAIRWARERGRGHVLLLNNDVVVSQPDLIDRMVEAGGPRIAAVGTLIEDRDGTVWSAGGFLKRWLGHAGRARDPRRDEPYDVDWLDGSAVLVSVAAACEIGGLAEDFFLYWEEVDWCTRARRAGWRCVLQPRARITHERGASATGRQTRYYALRNSLLFQRRNASAAQLVTGLGAWVFGRLPVFVVRRIVEGASPREALSDARSAVVWHLRDAAAKRAWRVPPIGPDVCGRAGE